MRSVWRRDRDGRWLLLAVAVHALLLGSARLAFREPPASLPAPKETPQELAVDYDLETWRNKSEVPGAARATTETPAAAVPRARQSVAPEPLDNAPPEAA